MENQYFNMQTLIPICITISLGLICVIILLVTDKGNKLIKKLFPKLFCEHDYDVVKYSIKIVLLVKFLMVIN